MYKMFSIHIVFRNGSNSYIRYNMDTKTFAKELTKWSRNYDLAIIDPPISHQSGEDVYKEYSIILMLEAVDKIKEVK